MYARQSVGEGGAEYYDRVKQMTINALFYLFPVFIFVYEYHSGYCN